MTIRTEIEFAQIATIFGALDILDPNFRVRTEVLLEDVQDEELHRLFDEVVADSPEVNLVDKITDGHYHCCLSEEEQKELRDDLTEFFCKIAEDVRNGTADLDEVRTNIEIRKVDMKKAKEERMPRIEALRTELSGLLNSGAGDFMIREAYGTCPIEWDYLANKYCIPFESIQVKADVKGWTIDLVGTEYNNMYAERYL